MFKNLTWTTAAKFYIWLAGMVATYTTSQTGLPEWVPIIVVLITLVAGWMKKQVPAEE